MVMTRWLLCKTIFLRAGQSHLQEATCKYELNLFSLCLSHFLSPSQAFINTAKEIYEKIQEGVFDINNEVRHTLSLPPPLSFLPKFSVFALFLGHILPSSSLCSLLSPQRCFPAVCVVCHAPSPVKKRGKNPPLYFL